MPPCSDRQRYHAVGDVVVGHRDEVGLDPLVGVHRATNRDDVHRQREDDDERGRPSTPAPSDGGTERRAGVVGRARRRGSRVRIRSPRGGGVTASRAPAGARSVGVDDTYCGLGSRGRPSRRSPMMLRCTWLVPPAMRPAGDASNPTVSEPLSIASGAAGVGAQRRDVERHLGDPELEQRAAGRGDRSTLVVSTLGERLVGVATGDEPGQLLALHRRQRSLGAERREALQPSLERDDRRADVAALVRQLRSCRRPSLRAAARAGGRRATAHR